MKEETFHQQGSGRPLPIAYDPLTGVQIRFGVIGSAGGESEAPIEELCGRLGCTIATCGCCLLTGACRS